MEDLMTTRKGCPCGQQHPPGHPGRGLACVTSLGVMSLPRHGPRHRDSAGTGSQGGQLTSGGNQGSRQWRSIARSLLGQLETRDALAGVKPDISGRGRLGDSESRNTRHTAVTADRQSSRT